MVYPTHVKEDEPVLKTVKQAFVRAVGLAAIEGRNVQPSVISYSKGGKFEIGRKALDESESAGGLIENFKIELGRHNPDAVTKRTTNRHSTSRITPVGIAQDFLSRVIESVEQYLSHSGRALPKNIVIAEPIAVSGPSVADEEWLSNYRRSIRRALKNRFDNL